MLSKMAAGVSISSLRVLGFTCLSLLLVETAGLKGVPYRVTDHVVTHHSLDPFVIDVRLYNDDVTLSRHRRDVPVDATTNTSSEASPPSTLPPSSPTPLPTTTATTSTTIAPTTVPTTTTTTTLAPSTPLPSTTVKPSTSSTPSTTTPTSTRSSTVSSTRATSTPVPSVSSSSTPRPSSSPSTPTPSDSLPTAANSSSGNETFNIVEEKDHKYYRSRIFKGEEAHALWVDLEDMGFKGSKTVHQTLSHSHRTAATAKLGFMFPFYGHAVYQVTIATGGFIYMSSFLHQWLTATQYIAPLMANFDTQIGEQSQIIYADNGTAFAVQWESVYLQDHQKGAFSFQAVLHKDGRVVFAYKQVPVNISSIPTTNHPVKVGLSDAYYEDRAVTEQVRRRTIYEYNRVSIDFDEITNDTAVIMYPNPTCIAIEDCKQCIMANISFDCQWCPDAGRCSDGLDRKRQDWLVRRCQDAQNQASLTDCPVPTTTTKPTSTTVSLTSKSTPDSKTTSPESELNQVSGRLNTTSQPASTISTSTMLNGKLSTTERDSGITNTIRTTKFPSVKSTTEKIIESTTIPPTLPSTITFPKHTDPKTTTSKSTTNFFIPTTTTTSTTTTITPSTTTTSTTTTTPTTTTHSTTTTTQTTTTLSPTTSTTSTTTSTMAISTIPSTSPTTTSSEGYRIISDPPYQKVPQSAESLGIGPKPPCKTPVTHDEGANPARPASAEEPVISDGNKAENKFKNVDECHKYPPRPSTPSKGRASPTSRRSKDGAHGLPIWATLVIVFILLLVVALVGWLLYAYKYPTSRAGMWLIEHRPSMLKAKLNKVRFWKRGGAAGDKYEVSVQPEGESVA